MVADQIKLNLVSMRVMTTLTKGKRVLLEGFPTLEMSILQTRFPRC